MRAVHVLRLNRSRQNKKGRSPEGLESGREHEGPLDRDNEGFCFVPEVRS